MNFKIVVLAMMLGIAGQVEAQDYREIVAKAQRDGAKLLREQLPIKLDDYTTLTDVKAVNTNLRYHYTVNAKRSEIDLNQFISQMSSTLESKVCGQNDMRLTIEHGGTYTYLYVGSDGLSLGDFTIGKRACGLLGAATDPYDSPFTFKKHLTDDGRVIYSNIPKECISKGRLNCIQLHPIFGSSVPTKRAE